MDLGPDPCLGIPILHNFSKKLQKAFPGKQKNYLKK